MIRNKKGRVSTALLFSLIALFCRMDRLNRADICTCTAIGANIRIDLVDVALRYSFNRTFIYTGSACSAIFVDFVSHDTYF